MPFVWCRWEESGFSLFKCFSEGDTRMLRTSKLGCWRNPGGSSGPEPQGRSGESSRAWPHGKWKKRSSPRTFLFSSAEPDFRVTRKGKCSSWPFWPHRKFSVSVAKLIRPPPFLGFLWSLVCAASPSPPSWPLTRSGCFILLSSVFCSKPWFLGRTPTSQAFPAGESEGIQKCGYSSLSRCFYSVSRLTLTSPAWAPAMSKWAILAGGPDTLYSKSLYFSGMQIEILLC